MISNPCFKLGFTAVAEIRARIIAARNNGAAVMLMSEDLDGIIELADRVLVMSGGRLVCECTAAEADVPTTGRWMGGHARRSTPPRSCSSAIRPSPR